MRKEPTQASDLDAQIAEVRATVQEALRRMEEIAQGVVAKGEEGIDQLLADYGKDRCPVCAGSGLDVVTPGWYGCPTCGGTREAKGRGYVDLPTEASDDRPDSVPC